MATSTQLRQRIATGEWDPKLRALYGNTEQELCRQRARYCAALEQFELYFGPGRQVQVYSAPGRAELGGNHTDHQHGRVLAAAVTLDKLAVREVALETEDAAKTLCVTVNPVSAYGWKFDKDEFLFRMKEAVDVPVINVKEELA